MKVYLKYTFIFDTDGPWKNKEDFDDDLKSYLSSCGFNPEVVQGEEDDYHNCLYLDKSEPDLKEEKESKKMMDKYLKV